jgi:uncharacterized protein YbjT (DUF2867 family)
MILVTGATGVVGREVVRQEVLGRPLRYEEIPPEAAAPHRENAC